MKSGLHNWFRFLMPKQPKSEKKKTLKFSAFALHLHVVRVIGICLLAAGIAQPSPRFVRAASGASFVVDSNSDADNALDGVCTLREAIFSANGDINYNECVNTNPGFGDDLIRFSIAGNPTITLASNLPSINNGTLTIDGSNSGVPVTVDGNGSFQPFYVLSGVTAEISNMTIQNGKMNSGGGAIRNDGTLRVNKVTFKNNTTTSDGGAILNYGIATISNSTFSGNSAGNAAGAISNNSATLTLVNSTLSGNSSGFGGALSTWNGAAIPSTTMVYNSILANSTGSEDCIHGDATGTFLGNNNIIESTPADSTACNSTTSFNTDPMLGALTGSPAYFPFTSSASPAIDEGDNSSCTGSPVNDVSQNGVPRPADGNGDNNPVCDIGSYEAPGVNPPSVVSINRSTPSPTNAASVNFTVNFSENVTGVDASDFTVTQSGVSGASVTTVSGSGLAYTVTVNTGTGVGTLRLDLLDDDTILDAAFLPLGYEGAGNGNFNGQVYSVRTQSFTDVPVTYWAWQYIERLASSGITSGCAAGLYCPTDPVTRAQMAVFLLKGIYGSSYTPPAVGGSTGFTDVATSYWAAAWIKQLAAEAITSGCGSGIYCPDNTVTRAQMAVFLLKAKHGSAFAPPAATGVFSDVATTYWAAAWIEQLAAEGITSGCAAGLYCPENPVTRDQMAVFLVKAFNLP